MRLSIYRLRPYRATCATVRLHDCSGSGSSSALWLEKGKQRKRARERERVLTADARARIYDSKYAREINTKK